jgi:hypothetical protein
MADFLADDPCGHGVDVKTKSIAAETVSLNERGSSAHEGVGDAFARELVRLEIRFLYGIIRELGQYKSAEQRSGPSGKPFVDSDERAIILLNLLFAQRHACDKRNVKILFDAH